jgi:hypothetical protein
MQASSMVVSSSHGIPFHVVVTRGAVAAGSSLFDFAGEVRAQNSVHAAACGLSLAGGGSAEQIKVTVLVPKPGRPAQVTYWSCSQGVYGFVYGSCSSASAGARR